MPPQLPDGAKQLPLTGILTTGGTGNIRDISSNYWFSALSPVSTTSHRFRVRQYQSPAGREHHLDAWELIPAQQALGIARGS